MSVDLRTSQWALLTKQTIFMTPCVKLLQGRNNWPRSCGLLTVHHQWPQLIYHTAIRRIRLQTHLSDIILGLLGCKWNRFLFKPPSKSVIIHKSAHKCFGNWQKKLTSEEEAIRMKTFQIMSFIRSLLIQQNLLLLQAIVVLNLCTFQ